MNSQFDGPPGAGTGNGTASPSTTTKDAARDRPNDTSTGTIEVVTAPTTLLRVSGVVRRVLEEVRAAPMDAPGRARLSDVLRSCTEELRHCMDPTLYGELNRMLLPLDEDHVASEGELRLGHAVLVGWLEGLLDGVEAAWSARQLAAKLDAQQRSGLRAGSAQSRLGGGRSYDLRADPQTGQYL